MAFRIENITDPRAITAAEAVAHSRGDTCPKCGAQGEYSGSEFGDDCVWQDAQCENGHEWREISTLTHVVALDPETAEEIGASVSYNLTAEVESVLTLMATDKQNDWTDEIAVLRSALS